MMREVAVFAEKAHRDVLRKGMDIPYITHPLGTAVIVSISTDDGEMTAVALLHNVMKDAGATKGGLEGASGARVTRLATGESKDKRKIRQEREGYTVRYLSTASRDIRILVLGDKLNSMRSTTGDYLVVGGATWQRFNEKNKKKYARYYWGIARALKELEEHAYYQGYIVLYRNVFGPDMCLPGEELPHSCNS